MVPLLPTSWKGSRALKASPVSSYFGSVSLDKLLVYSANLAYRPGGLFQKSSVRLCSSPEKAKDNVLERPMVVTVSKSDNSIVEKNVNANVKRLASPIINRQRRRVGRNGRLLPGARR